MKNFVWKFQRRKEKTAEAPQRKMGRRTVDSDPCAKTAEFFLGLFYGVNPRNLFSRVNRPCWTRWCTQIFTKSKCEGCAPLSYPWVHCHQHSSLRPGVAIIVRVFATRIKLFLMRFLCIFDAFLCFTNPELLYNARENYKMPKNCRDLANG